MNRWLKKNIITIILLLVLFTGIGLLAYPSFSNWWNSFHQSRAVSAYAAKVASMDREEYDRILKSAEKYNRELAETGIKWRMTEEEEARYNSELAIGDTGVMGYIDISKIQVQLPLYHGTDEGVLEIAIGHLSGTSLPVGGESSHCIVSGHRGLPSARLFTDIDKLVVGDTWTLNILDQTLTYEVDQIRVVLPTDLSNLTIEKGKDYCTLVTCTPYGINTHRLLVRGHRIPNSQGNARVTADALQFQPIYVAPFVAAPMLLIMLIVLIVTTRKGRKERKRELSGE